MIRLIFATSLVIATTAAQAQYRSYGYGSNSSSHYSSGYTTNSGTYVQPHYSTNPNNTQYDNYGARGNYNPYTGATGTRSPRY